MPYLRGLEIFPPDGAIVSSKEADTIEAKDNEKKMAIISVIPNLIAILVLTREVSHQAGLVAKR